MVYKCYFDGGNKDDSSVYESVTLANMCGFSHQWLKFESDWEKMLKRNHAPYLHTTDLYSAYGPYKGWSQTKCDAFVEDAVRVIRRHVAHRQDNPKGRREGLVPVIITIDLKDFLSVDKKSLNMSVSANELLFRQALGIGMSIGNSKRCTTFQMFFDQNEPFYGFMHDLKNSKNARKEAYLLDAVTGISEVDMRYYPALQLADLFAWTKARRDWAKRRVWHSQLLQVDCGHEFYDAANLVETIPGSQQLWENWKIPKRRATK